MAHGAAEAREGLSRKRKTGPAALSPCILPRGDLLSIDPAAPSRSRPPAGGPPLGSTRIRFPSVRVRPLWCGSAGTRRAVHSRTGEIALGLSAGATTGHSDAAQWARVRTPVDAFILARLEGAGLNLAPPADPRTLLRRITLGLTGLPPTPEEQQAFLADASPLAYSRLVDRLLASPAYGERWGRHWLDVARYADTNGYERDGDKPNVWRYRDYVIDAFNRDHPFDRFVVEQIAGDETPDSDERSQIATTFLRLGTWDDEPADATVDRYDQLDDVLGATTTAFLAQTVRCARCHNHKFEPISQKDYYRLLAVFEPLKRPQRGRADLDYPVGNQHELSAYRSAVARQQTLLGELARQIAFAAKPLHARVLVDGGKFPADVRKAFLTAAERRTSEQRTLVRINQTRLDLEARLLATSEEMKRLDDLLRRQREVKGQPLPELPRAYIWHEDGPRAPATHLLRRGDPALPGDEAAPGAPAILVKAPLAPPKPLTYSTGRRLWLANWIASSDNPLTARVIVNRVWQWHFGRGLVATAGDFGLIGAAPTHPELLDWLASEFIRGGWRLKHLHQLIVLSSTYQTSSPYNGGDAARTLALFGRWRQRRLEAEAVRDSMLAVSGMLNRQQGGPGVYPPLPEAVLAGQSRPGLGWGKSDERRPRAAVCTFSPSGRWPCPSWNCSTLPIRPAVASSANCPRPPRRRSRSSTAASPASRQAALPIVCCARRGTISRSRFSVRSRSLFAGRPATPR